MNDMYDFRPTQKRTLYPWLGPDQNSIRFLLNYSRSIQYLNVKKQNPILVFLN